MRALLNVGSLRDFERYIRACALRSGQMLNKSEIARDVGISPSTAGEWLSVLEASNQVYLLEPWFSNRTKSVVKTPKLYWADPGLLTFLVGIHTLEDLLLSPLKGAIWESTVFSEFRKRQAFSAEERELFYFRDRGLETDFLIHRGGRFELFEVKWTENPSPSHAAPLHKVAKILGPENVIRKSIISRAPARYTMNDDVEILPFDAEW